MVITKPDAYAGRTLEKHLELYDWKNEFFTFDQIIKTSPFDGFCTDSNSTNKVSFFPYEFWGAT